MSEPITPSDVANAKSSAIPGFVFDAFNELIAKEWDGHSATVRQCHAVEAIKGKMADSGTSGEVQMWWLNIEDTYRAAGWKVSYDKPGFNENYPATFGFTKQ